METKSLQIGNYVMHVREIITVSNVFLKGINATMDKATGKIFYIHAEQITPLPLASDLLNRLGFGRVGTRWALRHTSNLFVDRAVDKYYISIGPLGQRVCQVQFVHQLQNLFANGWNIHLILRK